MICMRTFDVGKACSASYALITRPALLSSSTVKRNWLQKTISFFC